MKLTDAIFTDAEAARTHLEATRWPDGAVCPHCGCVGEATKLRGKAHRAGAYQCNACREQFSVTVGTVFERSKVPLNKWLLATYLLSSGKKGVSAHQLHRQLGVTYKTAWFMAHRIREAMISDDKTGFGSGGGAVEVDETFIGRNDDVPRSRQTWQHKNRVLSLIDRDTGRARSFVVADFKKTTLVPILRTNIHRDARLMTDEANHYTLIGREFAEHGTVNHGADEYVRRSDPTVHTNTVEGFYSVFKRGMKGVYQHCGSQHLHRYTAEFDFRYTNRAGTGCDDTERTERALRGIESKRLTYRRIGETAHA